jgi:quinol monooxygenase YgiN
VGARQCQDQVVEQFRPEEAPLIIVAGQLHLDEVDRDRYLAAVADVARQARQAAGCHDFVQAADPIDAGRINVFERWESDEDLHRFRTSGGPLADLPALRSADVRKYRIAAVEAP